MAEKTKEWFTGEREHEGFPLLLRFPAKRDYKATCPKYPILTVVTHTLAKVKSNGLPESEYNETLLDMDEWITSSLECIVLVETFGGHRIYYGYSSDEAQANSIFTRIQSTFPVEKFSLRVSKDSSWEFIKHYSAEYGFYQE